MLNDTVLIDGSILEGGGQIIRTSLSCSSILKIPIFIEKIRGKRSKPGLQHQHLAGVKLLTNICEAIVSGDKLQSISLDFNPKTINSGKYEADAQTAGSVCLIIQSVVPTLLFGQDSSNLILLGGTDADFAPPIDYYENIVAFYLSKMNVEISIKTVRRGFYPRGGGRVDVDIAPINEHIEPICLLDRGNIVSMKAICFVAGSLPVSMAEDMRTSLERIIKMHKTNKQLQMTADVYKENPNKAIGNGSGCMLLVETSNGCRFGFNVVGKREYSGAKMGTEVANQFVDFFNNSMGCVDSRMQDQILIFMALAKGKSSIRMSELTLHSQTCIHILEKMTGVHFDVHEIDGSKDVVLSCEGIGFSIK